MHDPTRIDRIVGALRNAWEGQPDLSLPTIFGVAGNHGAGWGASDEQLLAVLEDMARIHPPLFPPALPQDRPGQDEARPRRVEAGQLWLLELSGHNAARVTIDSQRVIVRGFRQEPGRAARPVQPVVWEYAAIRTTGPGRPLVITDAEGFEHRLGVIERISLLEPAAPAAELGRNLSRRGIGEYCFVLRTQLADAAGYATVVIDHRLHIYSPARRSIDYAEQGWERILEMALGRPLRIQAASQLDLGVVEEMYIASAPVATIGDQPG